MTNEQLLYWIEGYLTDKHSTEAYTIKNKIAAQRSQAPTSHSTISTPGAGRAFVPEAVPMPPAAPVWRNCASEPDPF